MRRFRGEYPPDWPMIAWCIKTVAGWRCERCGAPDDHSTGHALTVHHLDNDKGNVEPWNLAALCQRCHLHIQGRVLFAQAWMLEHSSWMKPHVEGLRAAMDDAARVSAGLALADNRSVSQVTVEGGV